MDYLECMRRADNRGETAAHEFLKLQDRVETLERLHAETVQKMEHIKWVQGVNEKFIPCLASQTEKIPNVDFSNFVNAFAKEVSDVTQSLQRTREELEQLGKTCLLYTSPSPRDRQKSRMPSSA